MQIKIIKAHQLNYRLYTEVEQRGTSKDGEELADYKVPDDADPKIQFELAERVAFGYAQIMDKPSAIIGPMIEAFQAYGDDPGKVPAPKLADFTKKKAEAPKA